MSATAADLQSSAATPCAARAAAFEERLLQALNGGALTLLLSLGHRSGLLEALADGEWRSSGSLAAATGLTERYVREWLGGMTAAGAVEHDPESMRYRLPPEHAAAITSRAAANLAVYAQFVPLLAQVEDEVLRCLREGGGVPYERYPRFHEVMAEDSAQTVLPALIERILPLAPGLVERLEAGIRVADLGCGRGRALLLMAQRFPRSRFTGYELSAEAVAWAERSAREQGLANVRFEARDLGDFDRSGEPGAFELVTTFDAIHDQARPLALLRGIRRALAEDGVYLAQDIRASGHHHGDRDHPLGTLLYTVSLMHCTPVSLAQGGEGLGTMWGRERARELFARAGFGRIELHELEHDIQNDYWVLRP